jgi:hypothetical protein
MADEVRGPFYLALRNELIRDPEFRARVATEVAAAQQAAGDTPQGLPPDSVAGWMNVFMEDDRHQTTSQAETLKTTIDHMHRMLLLVTTILGLAIPGAAVARLIHPGWLYWSVAYFGGTLAVGVLYLFVVRYAAGMFAYQRNLHMRAVMSLLGASLHDARQFQRIGDEDARFELWRRNWFNRYWGLALLIAEVLFYSTFVGGVWCLCGGLLNVAR